MTLALAYAIATGLGFGYLIGQLILAIRDARRIRRGPQ